MTVLLAGFDGLDTERLSVQLREAGFSVVGASGRQSARTLAQGTSAGLVVVPEGSAGETAWSWILELLPNARVVSLAPTESSGDLIARLHQVAALVETDAIETPHNSEAPLTALPGLPMGQAPARTTGHAIAHTEANEPAAYPRKLPAQSGAPDLAAKLEEEWNAHGGHRDQSDQKRDQAVLHADNSLKFKEIIAVLDALYETKRDLAVKEGDNVTFKKGPAFNMTFSVR